MLGEVKEREVTSEPKPLVARHSTGFPKPKGGAARTLAAPNHGILKRANALAKKSDKAGSCVHSLLRKPLALLCVGQAR